MATIKKIEYPIKDNGFEYLDKHYDCHYAIERDMKMIIQEAETSHKDNFDEFYDRDTLKPDKIRLFFDENKLPIFGIIIYKLRQKRIIIGEVLVEDIICFWTITSFHIHIKKVFVGNKKE